MTFAQKLQEAMARTGTSAADLSQSTKVSRSARMKGKWRVLHNYVCGKMVIEVARVRDIREVIHAGNLEFYNGIFETDEEAEAMAARLNAVSLLPQGKE